MKRYLKYLKNKFFLVGLAMFTWLLFFDDNNLIYRYHAEQNLQKLKEDKQYYENRIQEMKARQQELKNNPDELERFAREEYLMKRPDEDLFIVVEE